MQSIGFVTNMTEGDVKAEMDTTDMSVVVAVGLPPKVGLRRVLWL